MVFCVLDVLVPEVMAQRAVSVPDHHFIRVAGAVREGAMPLDENPDLIAQARDNRGTRSHRQTPIGNALPGTDLRAFEEANSAFGEIENIHDGLGPTFNERFLHDGRASTLREAIQAHDGQGAAARDGFNALSRAEQRVLIKFLRSL
jgi:hypothetical protein